MHIGRANTKFNIL